MMSSEVQAPKVSTSTSDGKDASADRPHVLMIVGNDVTVDTRVRKMAHDVALAGPRVTVLGISATGQREEAMLGPAKIIRLLVNSTLRDNVDQFDKTGRLRRIRRRRRNLVTQRKFFLNYQREVGARIGWVRRDFFEGRTREREKANRYELEKLAALRNITEYTSNN